MLATYAVHSASTPLTIRTAHRAPRGREQERTHERAERASTSIRKSTHEQGAHERERGEQRESRERAERAERAESKRPAPTPAPLSKKPARLLASPRVREGF